MNSHKEKGKHSDDVTDFAELENRYSSLAAEEPPELLDQAVLNQARREAMTQTRKRRKAFGWIGAFSTVSLLVLGLSVVLQQQPTGIQPAALKEQDNAVHKSEEKLKKRDQPSAVGQSRDVYMAPPAEEEPLLESRQFRDESAALARTAAVADEPIPSDSDSEFADPEVWLLRIRQLIKDGQVEEAEVELSAFQQAYPDHVLPTDLSD